MAMKLERKFLLEFIDCYRRHPELWDHNREDYGHKVKKDKGYAELLQILQKIDVNATELDVRRKINGFRGGYRREKKKRQRLVEQYGASIEEPTLWWYNYFTFMDPIFENPQKRMKTDLSFLSADESQSSTGNMKDSPQSEEELDSFLSGEYKFFDVCPASPSEVKQFNQSIQSNQNQKQNQNSERLSNHVAKEQSSFNPSSRDEDASEIYSRAWAMQFKQLSGDQKIFAKKAIDDILFEASLGTLRRQSVIINDSLCQHCQTTFLNLHEEVEFLEADDR